MYKEFKPEVYCRRYENGGFKDKDNWQSEVKNIKDTIANGIQIDLLFILSSLHSLCFIKYIAYII